MVKTFYRVRARRHAAKRFVHLRHIVEIEGDVPLRQLRRGEAGLAPGHAIARDVLCFLQVTEIGVSALGEFQVADAGFQVEPDVIHVHGATSLRTTTAVSPPQTIPCLTSQSPRSAPPSSVSPGRRR